jgi:hypothetical protein
MFDTIFDLLASFAHILFELFEYSFELLIEYIFHTDHHHSEIILINFSFIIALWGVYWLSRRLFQLLNKLIAIGLKEKTDIARYWQAQTTLQKIKQVTIYATSFIAILFLLTLFI